MSGRARSTKIIEYRGTGHDVRGPKAVGDEIQGLREVKWFVTEKSLQLCGPIVRGCVFRLVPRRDGCRLLVDSCLEINLDGAVGVPPHSILFRLPCHAFMATVPILLH